MARPILTFDAFKPAGKQSSSAVAPSAPASVPKRAPLTFAEFAPRIRSDEGKIQGALVSGLESLRIKREQAAVDERNKQRASDYSIADPLTGIAPQEVFDPESFRPIARLDADKTIAESFGKYDLRRLDPAGIMAGVADQKLAARFKAAVQNDTSDLSALDYDEAGKMNGLFGQYDVADLQDVVARIRETFPEYGKDVDPTGLRASEVVDKFRREHYPDLTYKELMSGFGKTSRAERGMQSQIMDAQPKQATYGEALFENFRSALPALYADIKAIGAELVGDEESRKEAVKVRDTIRAEVAAANRGNDDTILGAAGLGIAGSLPALALGGPVGSAAGGVVARGAQAALGYRALRAGKAAIDVGKAARQAELLRKIGSQTTFASTVAPTAYVDAREDGASPGLAALNAVGNVAIEAVAEIPLFGTLAKAPKTYREAIKEYGKAVLGESIGEAGAAVAQPIWNNLTLGYDEALSNEELGRQALIGGLAGFGLGATVGGTGLARDAGNLWREEAVAASAATLKKRLGTSGGAETPVPVSPPQAAPTARQPVPARPAPAQPPPPAQQAQTAQQTAPAAAQAAQPVPAAPQPPQAARTVTETAQAQPDPQAEARALRESKAREDFAERLALFEEEQGRAPSQQEREQIATEVASDYEVLRASIYRPSQDVAAQTPTKGVQDVATTAQQPARPAQPAQPERIQPERGVDTGGVPARGDAARPDVPGGSGSVASADTGVAAQRADELRTAPAAAAPADQTVRTNNANATLTGTAKPDTATKAPAATKPTAQEIQSRIDALEAALAAEKRPPTLAERYGSARNAPPAAAMERARKMAAYSKRVSRLQEQIRQAKAEKFRAQLEAVKDDPVATEQLLMTTDPRLVPDVFGLKPPKRTREGVAQVSAARFLATKGGLNIAAWQSQYGVDRADMKDMNKASPPGKPLWRRNGGMTPDEAREALLEAGYIAPERGSVAETDPDMAFEAIEPEITGIGTPRYPVFGGADTDTEAQDYDLQIAEIERRQSEYEAELAALADEAEAAGVTPEQLWAERMRQRLRDEEARAAQNDDDIPFDIDPVADERARASYGDEVPFSQRQTPLMFSQRAGAGAEASQAAQSATPTIRSAQTQGARREESEAGGQPEGQGQGQGRQEGLLAPIEVVFLDEGHRDVVIPVDVVKDGKPASVRVKAGMIADMLAKRANMCAELLKCVRS
jgi:hypothetical protein